MHLKYPDDALIQLKNNLRVLELDFAKDYKVLSLSSCIRQIYRSNLFGFFSKEKSDVCY